MKGYIPVEIPTKRYIKAYICSVLGDKPLMSNEHEIGSKFYDLLDHKTNERKTQFANVRYNVNVKLYVSYHTFKQRGANLKETNITNFNRFVEKHIKRKFYDLMDFYIEMLPSFEANLPAVRKKLGIDIEEWSDDSMRKDYYRYRKENRLPPLYKKNSTLTVPSENAYNSPF